MIARLVRYDHVVLTYCTKKAIESSSFSNNVTTYNNRSRKIPRVMLPRSFFFCDLTTFVATTNKTGITLAFRGNECIDGLLMT